jgi:hypothetical protein
MGELRLMFYWRWRKGCWVDHTSGKNIQVSAMKTQSTTITTDIIFDFIGFLLLAFTLHPYASFVNAKNISITERVLNKGERKNGERNWGTPPLFVVMSKTYASSFKVSWLLFNRGFVSRGVTLLTLLIKSANCSSNRASVGSHELAEAQQRTSKLIEEGQPLAEIFSLAKPLAERIVNDKALRAPLLHMPEMA